MDLQYILLNGTINSAQEGPNLLHERPTLAVTYISFLVAATCLGTTGNILIIVTVIFNKKLRSIENSFIVNLAIADLCVTGFVDPFSIIGVIEGEGYFARRPALCELIASVCLTSCFCSLLSIGAISFNRCIHICYHTKYRKIYTPRKCLLMVFSLWIVSFCLEMPNFIGWGDHVFDHKTRSCVWDRTADFTYTLFFVLVGVVLPLIVISVCYVKIFVFVHQAKKRIAQMGEQSNGKQRKERQDSIKLARTLFIIFVMFTICWTPYACMVVFDVKDSFPMELHAFSILLAHTNSSLNCILYGVFNANFRKGYKELLFFVACKTVWSQKGGHDQNHSRTNNFTENTQVQAIEVSPCISRPVKSITVVGREPCA